MKIDWTKERCFVCSGEFKASSVQVTNERTGKTSTRKVMECVRCGDTAFSPEQRLAQKMKQPGLVVFVKEVRQVMGIEAKSDR
jgi:hypothetical protein